MIFYTAMTGVHVTMETVFVIEQLVEDGGFELILYNHTFRVN